jgi:small GTP-binding protein
MTYDRCFKIVLVGDSGVGKTSIINKICNDKFDPMSLPTIGGNRSIKVIEHNGIKIQLSFWDTAGQELYQSLTPMYTRGSDICIIAFDLSKEVNYDGLIMYYDSMKEQIGNDCTIFLCGNKFDIKREDLDLNRIKTLAKELNCPLFLVSAKEGIGIDHLLNESFIVLLAKSAQPVEEEPVIEVKKAEKKGCC